MNLMVPQNVGTSCEAEVLFSFSRTHHFAAKQLQT